VLIHQRRSAFLGRGADRPKSATRLPTTTGGNLVASSHRFFLMNTGFSCRPGGLPTTGACGDHYNLRWPARSSQPSQTLPRC